VTLRSPATARDLLATFSGRGKTQDKVFRTNQYQKLLS